MMSHLSLYIFQNLTHVRILSFHPRFAVLERKQGSYNVVPINQLRYCATNRKVAGSIPDGVTGIFHLHNPSDHTMALGSTQPLTGMSTRSISWG
jgi:hypothetical protein